MPTYTGDWEQLPDAEMVSPADVMGYVGNVAGPRIAKPQWVEGAGGLEPGPTLLPAEAISWELAHPEPLGPLFAASSGPTGWRVKVDYSRNLDLLSGWLLEGGDYHDTVLVETTNIVFADPDEQSYRTQAESYLKSRIWEQHPDAYNLVVEWEDWTPGQPFGTAHDRQVHVTKPVLSDAEIAATRSGTLYMVEDDGSGPGATNPQRADQVWPPLTIPEPTIDLWMAPAAAIEDDGFLRDDYTRSGSVFGYDPFVGGPGITWAIDTRFEAQESWTLDNISAGVDLGSLVPGLTTFNLDAYFASRAVLITDPNPVGLDTPVTTQAASLWLVPAPSLLQAQQPATAEVNISGTVTFSTSFTPPRCRVTYELDAVPIRRTFPRDDALAGGAFRTYPPSKAMQSSNRTSGGYL